MIPKNSRSHQLFYDPTPFEESNIKCTGGIRFINTYWEHPSDNPAPAITLELIQGQCTLTSQSISNKQPSSHNNIVSLGVEKGYYTLSASRASSSKNPLLDIEVDIELAIEIKLVKEKRVDKPPSFLTSQEILRMQTTLEKNIKAEIRKDLDSIRRGSGLTGRNHGTIDQVATILAQKTFAVFTKKIGLDTSTAGSTRRTSAASSRHR